MEMRVDPKKLENSIKMIGFDDMVYSEYFAGGIVVAWKKVKVNFSS